jgi:hypothetical protein
MAWTLKFWKGSADQQSPAVTWNYHPLAVPADVLAPEKLAIANYFTSIAAISTLASSRLSSYSQDIRIGFRAGDFAQQCICLDTTNTF